jgi:hypothetical protein
MLIRKEVDLSLVVPVTLSTALTDLAAKIKNLEELPPRSVLLEVIECMSIAIDRIGLTNHTEIA